MGYAIVGRRFNTWQELLEYSLKLKSAKLQIKKPKAHGFEVRIHVPHYVDKDIYIQGYSDQWKPEEAVKDSLPKIMQLLGIDYI